MVPTFETFEIDRDIVPATARDQDDATALPAQGNEFMIAEEFRNELGTLVWTLRRVPARRTDAGYIYIFTDTLTIDLDTEDAQWKVGAAVHPVRRWRALATGNLRLRLVTFYRVPRYMETEQEVHNTLKNEGRHIRLEWFHGKMNEFVPRVFSICAEVCNRQ